MRLKTLSAALLALGLGALSGCAGTPGPTALKDVRASANPADRAQRSITSFTPALRCMDDLMFSLGTRDVSLMMEEFRDATQRLPISARDMLTSAVSDMSRRSRGVRLTVFGGDQQNLTQILQLAQRTNAFAVLPQYNIRGTISQFDESVSKSGGSLGASIAQSFGVRFGSDTRFSVLGLDAAVVDTATMTLLPGVSSKNTTVLSSRDASAGDGQARLVNPAIGLVFSFAASRADGPAQAARNMIELSSVELVGKLIRAPYWQCVGTPDSDPEVQREMDDWFFSMAEEERIQFFKERLRERRYYDGPIDGAADARFDSAMQIYRRAMGLPAAGPLDLDFFKRFVTANVPRGPLAPPPRGLAGAPGAAGATASGAAPGSAAAATASGEAPAPAPAPAPAVAALPPALTLTLETLPAAAGALRPSPARLVIDVARPGYVYCYAQDPVTTRIQRVFPNRFTRDPRLEPGRPVVLPGRAAFVVNPAAQYACLHAPREVYGDLPPPLRWGDFEDVRLPDFAAIRDQFSLVAGMPVQMIRHSPANRR